MLVLVEVCEHVVHPRMLTIFITAAFVDFVTVKLQVFLVANVDRLAVTSALRVKPLDRF